MTQPVTPLSREEVERLLEDAISRPWTYWRDGRGGLHVETDDGDGIPIGNIYCGHEGNANLIATAPSLARACLALMDENVRLREAVDASRAELSDEREDVRYWRERALAWDTVIEPLLKNLKSEGTTHDQ